MEVIYSLLRGRW